MNFKPTLWKSIISFVLLASGFIFYYSLFVVVGAGFMGLGNKTILTYVISLTLITYIVWSLFQKGKSLDNAAAVVNNVTQK